MNASIMSIVERFRRSRTRRVAGRGVSYQQIESKKLLAIAAPPMVTTDVGVFLESTENAIVRIDEEASRLVIRLDGEDNTVDINLDFGYIEVNRTGDGPVLAIEPDRYDRILVFGNGDDVLNVVGMDLRAQLRPDRAWVASETVGRFGGERGAISVQATDVEDVGVLDSPLIDVGPFIYRSDNVVRFFGSDGDDHLTMTSDNPFLITTGATLVGEGYRYRVNSFGQLRVFAGEGQNLASIRGTRDFRTTDSVVGVGFQGSGVDQFFATDEFSRIRNDRFEAQFSGFDITRVDLLSGDDSVHVVDTQATETAYQVDGETLVGNFRRFINAERITIDGSAISDDTLRIAAELQDDFEEDGDSGDFAFERTSSGQEDTFLDQVVPVNFFWGWRGFEEFVLT